MDRQLDSRAPELAFERKVQAGAWAVFFERLWPRVWLVLGIVGAFVAVSLTGLWPLLGEIPHRILLALFALALLAALVFMARVRWPSRKRRGAMIASKTAEHNADPILDSQKHVSHRGPTLHESKVQGPDRLTPPRARRTLAPTEEGPIR